jgi:hypothetical protein
MPAAVHLPAAIILLAGGLVACFLGYRLFRLLVAVCGFVGGLSVGALLIEGVETWAAAILLIASGLVGTALFLALYLAGVSLLGAAIAALAVHLVWPGLSTNPQPWLIFSVCLVGAIAAVLLRRYVIIIGTSFGGAWGALVGSMALAGHPAAVAAASGDLWGVYPMAPARGQMWFAVGWLALAAAAILVQLSSTGRARAPKSQPQKTRRKKQDGADTGS